MNLMLRKTWPNDPQHKNDFVVVLDGKTDLARIRRLIAAGTKLMTPANEWRPGRPYVA